jgi:hypothetical protein
MNAKDNDNNKKSIEHIEVLAIWKLAKILWISGLTFWAIETTIFLILEGWHLKATNPIEIRLDAISSSIWEVSLFLTLWVCCQLLWHLNKTK